MSIWQHFKVLCLIAFKGAKECFELRVLLNSRVGCDADLNVREMVRIIEIYDCLDVM